jgi:hypothetical protein
VPDDHLTQHQYAGGLTEDVSTLTRSGSGVRGQLSGQAARTELQSGKDRAHRYAGYVKPQSVDVVSAEPQAVCARVVWVLAVALLAAALAAAITIAVHYRGEVASLRRHLRSAPTSIPPSSVPLTLSTRTVALPPYGALNGAVTVVSARSSGSQARILLSVHLSGGKPNTSYALTSFDCAGSTGYQSWAAGITGADGSGALSGPALTVSLSAEYWLYLMPSSSEGSAGPGLDARFTAAGTFSASPAGNPAC